MDGRAHSDSRKARPPHVRDTRESRLLLVLLVAVAFALITVDIRGGQESPVDGARQAAAAVFGPVENGVAAAVDPIGNAIGAVRDSGERHNRIAALEKENAALKAELGSDDRNRNRLRELDSLLKTAGAGQYGIKGAQVIAIGSAQGFSWTVTIDVGARDGIQRDMKQIAMADFTNPMGLEKVGETSYRESANSGAAQLGVAGQGRLGTLVGGALEMSNVDLAAEFTNLILAQRGFQASSRVITTSDQVLEDLVNIKR